MHCSIVRSFSKHVRSLFDVPQLPDQQHRYQLVTCHWLWEQIQGKFGCLGQWSGNWGTGHENQAVLNLVKTFGRERSCTKGDSFLARNVAEHDEGIWHNFFCASTWNNRQNKRRHDKNSQQTCQMPSTFLANLFQKPISATMRVRQVLWPQSCKLVFLLQITNCILLEGQTSPPPAPPPVKTARGKFPPNDRPVENAHAWEVKNWHERPLRGNFLVQFWRFWLAYAHGADLKSLWRTLQCRFSLRFGQDLPPPIGQHWYQVIEEQKKPIGMSRLRNHARQRKLRTASSNVGLFCRVCFHGYLMRAGFALCSHENVSHEDVRRMLFSRKGSVTGSASLRWRSTGILRRQFRLSENWCRIVCKTRLGEN